MRKKMSVYNANHVAGLSTLLKAEAGQKMTVQDAERPMWISEIHMLALIDMANSARASAEANVALANKRLGGDKIELAPRVLPAEEAAKSIIESYAAAKAKFKAAKQDISKQSKVQGEAQATRDESDGQEPTKKLKKTVTIQEPQPSNQEAVKKAPAKSEAQTPAQETVKKVTSQQEPEDPIQARVKLAHAAEAKRQEYQKLLEQVWAAASKAPLKYDRPISGFWRGLPVYGPPPPFLAGNRAGLTSFYKGEIPRVESPNSMAATMSSYSEPGDVQHGNQSQHIDQNLGVIRDDVSPLPQNVLCRQEEQAMQSTRGSQQPVSGHQAPLPQHQQATAPPMPQPVYHYPAGGAASGVPAGRGLGAYNGATYNHYNAYMQAHANQMCPSGHLPVDYAAGPTGASYYRGMYE